MLRLLNACALCLATAAIAGCDLFFPTPEDTDTGIAEVSVSMTSPSQTRTVPEGTNVDLAWTIFINPVDGATLRALVEARPSLEQTVIFENQALANGSQSGNSEWDTEGFAAGLYVLRLQVLRDGTVIQEARSRGDITVDARPTFEFTQPTANATLELNRSLEFEWVSQDAEAVASVVVGLDPDTDFDSGNEVTLTTFTMTAEEETDTLEWRGLDDSGAVVDPNQSYNLFAAITDEVGGDRTINPGIQITIEQVADPNAP